MSYPDPHIGTGWLQPGGGGGRPPGRFGRLLRWIAIVFLVAWFGWMGWMLVSGLFS